MERYIKYKRISESYSPEGLQDFFDKLISDGWEIINYNERIDVLNKKDIIRVVVICGKKQSNIL